MELISRTELREVVKFALQDGKRLYLLSHLTAPNMVFLQDLPLRIIGIHIKEETKH